MAKTGGKPPIREWRGRKMTWDLPTFYATLARFGTISKTCEVLGYNTNTVYRYFERNTEEHEIAKKMIAEYSQFREDTKDDEERRKRWLERYLDLAEVDLIKEFGGIGGRKPNQKTRDALLAIRYPEMNTPQIVEENVAGQMEYDFSEESKRRMEELAASMVQEDKGGDDKQVSSASEDESLDRDALSDASGS